MMVMMMMMVISIALRLVALPCTLRLALTQARLMGSTRVRKELAWGRHYHLPCG